MRNWIYVVAAVKILVSFAWMITIALTPTMGVAWHRFLAFPNIWFKREASGRTALGAVRPLTVDAKGGCAASASPIRSSCARASATCPA